jgi:hypothetical protein
MTPFQLGLSLAAVLALGLVARLLRLGESRISTPAQAREMAEQMLVGFESRAALVSRDGSGALVAGNGAFALLKRHGANVAARRLIAPLRLREAVEGVTVISGERRFGDVTLLDVVESDVRGLEAQLTRV